MSFCVLVLANCIIMFNIARIYALTCRNSQEASVVSPTFIQDLLNQTLMHSDFAYCLHMKKGGVLMICQLQVVEGFFLQCMNVVYTELVEFPINILCQPSSLSKGLKMELDEIIELRRDKRKKRITFQIRMNFSMPLDRLLTIYLKFMFILFSKTTKWHAGVWIPRLPMIVIKSYITVYVGFVYNEVAVDGLFIFLICYLFEFKIERIHRSRVRRFWIGMVFLSGLWIVITILFCRINQVFKPQILTLKPLIRIVIAPRPYDCTLEVPVYFSCQLQLVHSPFLCSALFTRKKEKHKSLIYKPLLTLQMVPKKLSGFCGVERVREKLVLSGGLPVTQIS
ncbi:putative signal peptide protein [Puccinia sorghi]|uniref:Putative signal peptide protein n=1 Tax=Puccinia sorghi TaxID=27349 RepID=A0A0L6V7N0_9BASI|nr:putative signal peptide protein [Puccinia sorghi]